MNAARVREMDELLLQILALLFVRANSGRAELALSAPSTCRWTLRCSIGRIKGVPTSMVRLDLGMAPNHS